MVEISQNFVALSEHMTFMPARIIFCLATLELWLVQFCCIFAGTKDKFVYLLKKLFRILENDEYDFSKSISKRGVDERFRD